MSSDHSSAQEKQKRSLLILFASETGCAEDVALRIAREARQRHFRPTRTLPMDSYDKVGLVEERLVVFVCSTTGQGEEPENMKAFWRFLKRKDLPLDALVSLRFAVFGLGDSSYEKFNFPAKKLFKRMQQLGANPLLPRGDGDDQHYLGVDGTLDLWLMDLWSVILSHYPLPIGSPMISDDILPEPIYHLEFLGNFERLGVEVPPIDADTFMDSSRPEFHMAHVLCNERITSSHHFQDVRHIELDAGYLKYAPGDIAVILPQNLPDDVHALITHLGWETVADVPVQISAVGDDTLISSHWTRLPWTLRRLLTHRLSVFSPPRRHFFKYLSYFSTTDLERQKLRELSSTEGQEDLQSYCLRQKRTALEVLRDFPNSKLPPEYVMDVFPELKPRQFSISSAMSRVGNRIHLTVAVVRYKTNIKGDREGICTRWLKDVGVWGERRHGPGPSLLPVVPLRTIRGSMRVPQDLSIPVILVGPGTGIAPMRAFIQQRLPCPFESSRNLNGPTTALFFGFRNPTDDFYYRSELTSLVRRGWLTLCTAVSRANERCYVQDRIRKEGEWLWDWISKGAVIRVSGKSGQMPMGVRAAFAEVAISHAGMDGEVAAQYIAALITEGRYLEECWA